MNRACRNGAWRYGANFIPSTAINQLEMWQAATFDETTIRRELGYAAKIGMSVMRVYLHDLLWEQDAHGFLQRMEAYLEIADSFGLFTVFVFFDDCWNSKFKLGKQPDPRTGVHNSGWLQSPGECAADDPSQHPRLEKYVKGVLTHFAHDRRIFLWDLYNEPGNGCCGDHVDAIELREKKSLPLLQKIFQWARECAPNQPITAGVWKFTPGFDEINEFLYKNSDVVSFHSYESPVDFSKCLAKVQSRAGDRPVLCSEYMARATGCTFGSILPLLKRNNVTAINWGLVSGKTQTTLPWHCMRSPEALSKPFHDIFNADGTFLCPEEQLVFNDIGF